MAIDWTKPVRFKDTTNMLRVLCTDRPNSNLSVVLVDQKGAIFTRNIDGSGFGFPPDIENAPETKATYINVYLWRSKNDLYVGSTAFKDYEKAVNLGKSAANEEFKYLKTVKIEAEI